MCSQAAAGFFCGSEEERVPVSVFRYYVYEKWLANYAQESMVFLADFRDLVFQRDPFPYRAHESRDYSLQVHALALQRSAQSHRLPPPYNA